MIYFDHNATAPLHPAARDAWLAATEKFIANPSSPHRLGGRAEKALADAREQLAGFLGCAASDIVWTSGATEANNAVLHHFASRSDGAGEVWLSAVEHPCLRDAAERYFPKRHRLIPVPRSGVVDMSWLRREIVRKRPELVAVMAANNETGVLQPWREVLTICREHGVPCFCDAAQWLGKRPARGLGEMDFVSGCAHKFGGPVGVGFLKCPAKGRMHPLLVGGPQEEGRRAGTENVAGVLAMLAALVARERLLATDSEQERLLWRTAFETMLSEQLPGTEVVGAGQPRLWNTVCALMPEADCQSRLVVKLDKFGFAVSTGSACASGKEAPSHVMTAMGFTAGEAGRVLRFSSGWETTEADWQSLIGALRKVSEQALTRHN